MTAFGGIFRSPELEGVEGSGENGERGRIVGLDLDSGVVRVQPRPVPADQPAPADAPDELDEPDERRD